jgi:hypothetical protein
MGMLLTCWHELAGDSAAAALAIEQTTSETPEQASLWVSYLRETSLW